VNSRARDGNPSGKSLVFTALKDNKVAELDNLFEGMKVDIFDEPTGKWNPGTIEKLQRNS
jgi:hypothetical protein